MYIRTYAHVLIYVYLCSYIFIHLYTNRCWPRRRRGSPPWRTARRRSWRRRRPPITITIATITILITILITTLITHLSLSLYLSIYLSLSIHIYIYMYIYGLIFRQGFVPKCYKILEQCMEVKEHADILGIIKEINRI